MSTDQNAAGSLLQSLFGGDYEVQFDGVLSTGTGKIENQAVAILGTIARPAIGAELALRLARHVLDIMRDHPGRAILLIVENSGQRLSLFDELMGNNGYIAHLSSSLDLARRRGHRVIGLVHDLAVSAGFMATGMATSDCYALDNAELRVMAREAMSQITRIPLERLDELTKTNPVLGPSIRNFERIGAIAEIWSGDLREHLRKALQATEQHDPRRERGAGRGGRVHAAAVARAVREGRRTL